MPIPRGTKVDLSKLHERICKFQCKKCKLMKEEGEFAISSLGEECRECRKNRYEQTAEKNRLVIDGR